MSRSVFLDASFWIVYRDECEVRHPVARQTVIELFRQRARLVTTFPVVCEIHAYFSRHRRKRELILNELWNNPILLIEEVSSKDQEMAVSLLRAQTDKSYSLCDALSCVVMRRLKIKQVASFDDHFRQMGEFEIIPQSHV